MSQKYFITWTINFPYRKWESTPVGEDSTAEEGALEASTSQNSKRLWNGSKLYKLTLNAPNKLNQMYLRLYFTNVAYCNVDLMTNLNMYHKF